MRPDSQNIYMMYEIINDMQNELKNEIVRRENCPQFRVTGLKDGEYFEFKPGQSYQATLTNKEDLMLKHRNHEIGRPIAIIYNDEADNEYFDTPYRDKTDGRVLKRNTIINVRQSDKKNQRVQLKLKRY